MEQNLAPDEPDLSTIPYAQRLETGVEPKSLYRVLAIAGLLMGVGRLFSPLRTLLTGAGLSSLVGVPTLGIPGISTFISLLVLMLSVISAVVVLIACAGILSGRFLWRRWLWVSESATLCVAVATYGFGTLGMIQRRNVYPANFVLLYPLGIFSAAAFPILLMLLVRMLSKSEEANQGG